MYAPDGQITSCDGENPTKKARLILMKAISELKKGKIQVVMVIN